MTLTFGEFFYPGLFAFDHQKVFSKKATKSQDHVKIQGLPTSPLEGPMILRGRGLETLEIPTVYIGCCVFGGDFTQFARNNMVLIHLIVHVPPEITKHQHLNHSFFFTGTQVTG